MTIELEPDPPVGRPPEPGRRLYRSRTNRMFAGVCGGVAAYFGSDPTAVRLLAALIAVLTGIVPFVVLYLVAAVVVPEAETDEAVVAGFGPPRSIAPGRGALVFGAILVGIGVLALANEVLRIDWDLLWPFALIALGVVLVLGVTQRPGTSGVVH